MSEGLSILLDDDDDLYAWPDTAHDTFYKFTPMDTPTSPSSEKKMSKLRRQSLQMGSRITPVDIQEDWNQEETQTNFTSSSTEEDEFYSALGEDFPNGVFFQRRMAITCLDDVKNKRASMPCTPVSAIQSTFTPTTPTKRRKSFVESISFLSDGVKQMLDRKKIGRESTTPTTFA
jgi:hypothetical protein